VQQELSTLRSQLAALENSQSRNIPGDTEVSASQVPVGGLEYARKLREVKYHDTLLDLLARQYEAARLDEAKSAPIIQVVDRSVPPDKKSGPPRLLIILGATLFGFCAACAYVLLGASLEHSQRNHVFATKLSRLRRELLWRKT
jgi:tyrosine-protein kinase Etk/Wzc